MLFNILVIVILSLPLAGCFTLGLAAGAGGAYVASKEFEKSQEKQKRAAEKDAVRSARAEWERERSKSSGADAKTAAIINARLLGGELTKVITIHTLVRSGVVTLFGNVPSQKVAERAIEVARSMPGVKEVRSNLVVVEMQIIPVNPGASFPDFGPANTEQFEQPPPELQPAQQAPQNVLQNQQPPQQAPQPDQGYDDESPPPQPIPDFIPEQSQTQPPEQHEYSGDEPEPPKMITPEMLRRPSADDVDL